MCVCSFDSPQFSEAVLEEVIPTCLVPKSFGKWVRPLLQSLNPRGRALFYIGLVGMGSRNSTNCGIEHTRMFLLGKLLEWITIISLGALSRHTLKIR